MNSANVFQIEGKASTVHRATLPATCGELVQGIFDGTPALVSCPIDRFSAAIFEFQTEPSLRATNGSAGRSHAALPASAVAISEVSEQEPNRFVAGAPRSDRWKSMSALRAGMRYFGKSGLSGQLQLGESLPSGRGYGTSTA